MCLVAECPSGLGSGGAKEFYPYSHPVEPAQAHIVILCFILKKTPLGRDFSCFIDKKMSPERSWSCTSLQDKVEQRALVQDSSLSPFLPAGHGPTGPVDRSSGYPVAPGRLALWPPGLRPCAPDPALLPAGMKSVGQTGRACGLSWASGSLALRATAGIAHLSGL